MVTDGSSFWNTNRISFSLSLLRLLTASALSFYCVAQFTFLSLLYFRWEREKKYLFLLLTAINFQLLWRRERERERAGRGKVRKPDSAWASNITCRAVTHSLIRWISVNQFVWDPYLLSEQVTIYFVTISVFFFTSSLHALSLSLSFFAARRRWWKWRFILEKERNKWTESSVDTRSREWAWRRETFYMAKCYIFQVKKNLFTDLTCCILRKNGAVILHSLTWKCTRWMSGREREHQM